MAVDRIGKIEDALGEAQARLAALGTFQVAIALALDRTVQGYSEEIDRAIEHMRQQRAQAGLSAEAAILNGIAKQLHDQRRLPAND